MSDSEGDTGTPAHPKWDPPTGVVDDNGTFLLQTVDMLRLMKFIWSGCLLPTTRAQYALRLSFDWSDINSDVSNEIDKMLSTYKEVYNHTSNFRDHTYSNMVDLADSVYNIATTAGGKKDDSYYKAMMKYVKEYYEELNGQKRPDKLKELKDGILYLIKAMTTMIDGLLTSSKQVKQDLIDFEKTSKIDETNLIAHNTALGKLLEGDNGEIKKLQREILDKREELKTDQSEYDRGNFPIGTIAGATVIGVYTDKINKLRKQMNDIQDLIDSDEAKVQADKRLAADIGGMQKDITGLISMINPAMKTIEKLEGCWQKISGDLSGLETLISQQDTDNIAPWLAEKPMQKKVLHKWNALAKYVDKYRQIARMDQPEITDLQGYLNAL
ncbi:predicted protein [Uncinocarpus reesii 1704]|uniref:Uncharacterized protein n=1 Tax=Uncinocarpus reesii (strain UAMH 1704) TaxID=336963 RepID=C4JLM2_UNCRE|nr:uncharacterized protein UREG_03730 [Uncinocarpus reesii 1704]EEP78884.1 predicted protein [Uncinocarpus reesii 1704]